MRKEPPSWTSLYERAAPYEIDEPTITAALARQRSDD